MKERCGQCGCRLPERQSRTSRPRCDSQGHHELGVGSRVGEGGLEKKSDGKCDWEQGGGRCHIEMLSRQTALIDRSMYTLWKTHPLILRANHANKQLHIILN